MIKEMLKPGWIKLTATLGFTSFAALAIYPVLEQGLPPEVAGLIAFVAAVDIMLYLFLSDD